MMADVKHRRDRRAAHTPYAPPADRGRLLGTGDIIHLMTVLNKHGVLEGPSAWTVTHHVCPEGKMRLGGECYWFEQDFLNWLESKKQSSAA